MKTGPSAAHWPFAIWWGLACTIGYSVAFPVGFALGDSVMWGWSIGGLAIGLLQWALLRRRARQALWWVPFTLLGAVLGSAASFVMGEVILQAVGLGPAFMGLGAVIGLGVGLSQWAILSHWIPRAGWWIWANIAGYSLGVYGAYLFPSFLPTGRIIYGGPEFGLVIGAVVGAITGVSLAVLFRRPVPWATANGAGGSSH